MNQNRKGGVIISGVWCSVKFTAPPSPQHHVIVCCCSLLYPTDSQGNSCGQGDFSDRRNLFYFDLLECIPKDVTSLYKITSCPTQQICVKDCPSKNTMFNSLTSKREDMYCTDAVSGTYFLNF